MKKKVTIAALLLASALPLTAQDWSLGVGTGAFVFGDFVERKLRPVNSEGPEEPQTLTLSAATRPGLSVDVERSLSDRWAIRLEGTFTRAPLAVKDTDDEGVSIDAGEVDVATFMLPIVFRINRGGALRFHLFGGPAHAIYRFSGNTNSSGIAVLDTTRSEWGAAAGLGAAWHLSDRFAIEGAISDIVTTSPFDRDDFADVPGIDVPKPHNVHTTVGLRWSF